MGFQPFGPQGFVLYVHVCVLYVCVQMKTLKPDKWKLILQRSFLWLFFFHTSGFKLFLFQEQFLSWLKAAEHDKWMCLCAADVSLWLYVCTVLLMVDRMEERRGAEEAGCYFYCQMSSMYLKPCVKDSCVCVNVCVCVCLPSRLDFFSAYQLLAQNFGFRVHGKEYKSCATQSFVESAARLLLNKSQAITEYNPFHILYLLHKMQLLWFKNSPAMPRHFSSFFFLTWTSNCITLRTLLEMWFHLSGKDLMRFLYRWWHNVTALSQDVAPPESSSLPPAAPLDQAIWTVARRSPNQYDIKTSIHSAHTHKHTVICACRSAYSQRKHQQSQIKDTLLCTILCAISFCGWKHCKITDLFCFYCEDVYIEQRALVNGMY